VKAALEEIDRVVGVQFVGSGCAIHVHPATLPDIEKRRVVATAIDKVLRDYYA